MSRAVIPRHGKEMHRCNGEDPIPVLWHKKCFDDTKLVTVGDGPYGIVITDDLAGTYLRTLEASITTLGSSLVQVQIHNAVTGLDMLTTRVQIDAGEYSSYTAATRSVVNTTGTPPRNYATRGHLWRIDVDSAGGTAKGLEIWFEFGPALVSLTP